MRGAATDAINAAMQWCTANLKEEPLGRACPLRSMEDIKAASSAQVLFSGALHQLRLDVQAMEDSMDFGRIAKFLEGLSTVKDLHLAIGDGCGQLGAVIVRWHRGKLALACEQGC